MAQKKLKIDHVRVERTEIRRPVKTTSKDYLSD